MFSTGFFSPAFCVIKLAYKATKKMSNPALSRTSLPANIWRAEVPCYGCVSPVPVWTWYWERALRCCVLCRQSDHFSVFLLCTLTQILPTVFPAHRAWTSVLQPHFPDAQSTDSHLPPHWPTPKCLLPGLQHQAQGTVVNTLDAPLIYYYALCVGNESGFFQHGFCLSLQSFLWRVTMYILLHEYPFCVSPVSSQMCPFSILPFTLNFKLLVIWSSPRLCTEYL